MSAILLLVAVVLFAVDAFGGHIGDLNLVSLGLAFFAGSFLVGPVTDLVRRSGA